jgi:hypothetical protein
MTKFELLKRTDSYLIQGQLMDGTVPNALCLVLVVNALNYEHVANTTTDVNGYYAMSVPHNEMPPGNYMMQFYGWGVQAVEPEGDWVPFNIIGTGEVSSSYIISAEGTIVKYGDGIHTPSPLTLTVHYSNISTPSFVWNVSADNSDTITVDSADLFVGSDSAVIQCTITGVDDDGVPVSTISQISISRIVDGAAGPGTTYRGVYDPTKQYFKTATHCDIVKYVNDYYSCKVTTPDPASSFNPTKWEVFGNQFDSVATDILLTQDATITRALVMGEESTNFGIIRSYLATEPLSGNGFYLANTSDGTGRFRVGSITALALTKGILWDGAALSIKATGFELTPGGDLWASSGGFGGTVAAPKIVLTSDGLQAGKTLIHGNEVWASPLTNLVTNSDDGLFWSLTGTGTQSQNELSLEYTTTTQGPNLFVTPIVNSGSWNSISMGDGFAIGNSSISGVYFRKELVLQAGVYLVSFDIVINPGKQGVFEWKLSTASNLATGSDVGSPIIVTTSGNYTATITVPSNGTYYFGARNYAPGYPWTAVIDFNASNINFKIDGVTGTEANTYYLFSKTLDSSCVGKIYEFKGKFNGTSQLNQKHKFKLQILIDDVVVKESTYSKPDGAVASPFSISYTNAASSGTLKVKIIYTGILPTTELPEIT